MASTMRRIAQINDAFRKGDRSIPGKRVSTEGINRLLEENNIPLKKLVKLLWLYDGFCEDNDPFGAHDFGNFTLAGRKCFWKIDYFDMDYKFASPDPTDLSKTRRVLTVLLAEEW